MNRGLPRQARVRAPAEFEAAFKQGRRTASPIVSLHWNRDDQPARLGLAVSRKVDRRAVGRNRIKRAWREAFRQLRDALPGGSYVLVARPAAAASDTAALVAALHDVLLRAGALPVPAPGGTMPRVSPPLPHTPAPSGE